MSDQNSERLAQIKQSLDHVKAHLRVTKVVATRAVKTSKGDFFAGISAAWDSVQDDAGGMGSDQDLTVTADDQASSGMTLKEAQISQLVVSMEASIGAYRAALSEGAISEDEFERRIQMIKRNTVAHIDRLLPKSVSAAETELSK